MKVSKYILALTLVVCCLGSAHAQIVKSDTVIHAVGNPIIRHEFTADPAAMVYKAKYTCTPAMTKLQLTTTVT
jgi:hypothetical protein